MNTEVKSLSPQELLDYTLEAAQYFLKDPSVSYVHKGKTTEDLAMDAIEAILRSNVLPRSRTYVTETVRLTIASHYRREPKASEQEYMEAKDTREVPMIPVDALEDDIMATLIPEDQWLYYLYFIDGKTEEEIGHTYSVHPRTIRRRLAEIKDLLKETLQDT